MTYAEFKDAVTQKANEAGLTAYDLYYDKGRSTNIEVFEQKVDSFSDNTGLGICFRCVVEGEMGLSHTQELSEEEAFRLVKDARESALFLEGDKKARIFKGSAVYRQLEQPTSLEVSVSQLKEFALNMEKQAFEEDSRIVNVPGASISYGYGETAICNSYGLDLTRSEEYYVAHCEVVAEEKGKRTVGYDSQIVNRFAELDSRKLVHFAVERAIAALSGKPVPTGNYPILFENRVMCDLLMTFSSVFSGDLARKGLSLLKGKEGEMIAHSNVTITDDPFLLQSPFRSAFDDEGVATATKNVIEGGRLNTLLYDLETADALGKESTGNGRKSSYAGGVSVRPFNLVLQPGLYPRTALFEKAHGGLMVTELMGLHASADATSGDFSLEAKGFCIQDGTLSKAAEQFTVAGNFFDLLREAEFVGNDFYFRHAVGAPSVLILSMSVAGTEPKQHEGKKEDCR